MPSKFTLILLLGIVFALPGINAFSYSLRTSLDYPVNKFLLTPDQNILIGSHNTIFAVDLDGNFIFKISLYNTSVHIRDVAVSSSGIIISLWDDNNIRIFHPDHKQVEFSLSGDTYNLWYDEMSRTLITIQYPALNMSVLNFIDLHGQLIANYTIDFLIADLIVSEGFLFFDNFLWSEPAVYIYIADIEGVLLKINTTRKYPSSGLALNGRTIVVAEYGIDTYAWNGTFINHILGRNLTIWPQVYDDKIAYYDLWEPVPQIRFVDMTGNPLYTLEFADHSVDQNNHQSTFYFTLNGDLVANIGDEIRVFERNS